MTRKYEVEYDETDGLRMVVIRLTDGYSRHRCGYVGVDKEHPFHGKDYSFQILVGNPESLKTNPTDPIGTLTNAFSISENNMVSIGYLASVHGGVTYSGGSKYYPVESDLWWFGFDAAHSGDDYDGGQPLKYMIENCKQLKDFLLSVRKVKKTAEIEVYEFSPIAETALINSNPDEKDNK